MPRPIEALRQGAQREEKKARTDVAAQRAEIITMSLKPKLVPPNKKG